MRKKSYIVLAIFVIILCVLASFVVKIYIEGTPSQYRPTFITLELYQQNDTANQVVWIVKNITMGGGEWEDIWGYLIYSNGTKVRYNRENATATTLYGINNSSLRLPTGKIKVGDLIIVNAPWDGDAVFRLLRDGDTITGTSEVHY